MGIRKKDRAVPVINQAYYNSQTKESLYQQRKRKLLYRRLGAFFAFVLIFAVIVARTIYSQHILMKEKESQLEALQTKYEKIQETQKVLKEEIVKLQDDEYLGKYARQELFMSDDGEIIFSIPNEEDGKDSD